MDSCGESWERTQDGSIRMITEENVTAIPWGASSTAQDYDH